MCTKTHYVNFIMLAEMTAYLEKNADYILHIIFKFNSK